MKAKETARISAARALSARAVILDPPRAGAPELMDPIAKLGAPSVLYVSCNLTTLARDLRALGRHG